MMAVCGRERTTVDGGDGGAWRRDEETGEEAGCGDSGADNERDGRWVLIFWVLIIFRV